MTSAHPAGGPESRGIATFWRQTPNALGATLGCGTTGLLEAKAERRLERFGPNSDAEARHVDLLRAVLRCGASEAAGNGALQRTFSDLM